ncbi:NAD-dependent epimerase/dehydratase family protein [Pseudarthrobacter enclensis]|uniref:Nucleoside-diphosphate-sugar epimerase n=1 Tax=Pseudarthrobacter enclensis TaxID=993070 RepID=A0ABT9RYH4_9MICC|nr:NAD-dependent epimerase/dehydratase family protein [Pseudarthrobacter enclensis]MDP9890302.1 nucleoside-diphosphate-sugar epimerase [Pseudarthrobacter enclensis]
MTILLAGCGDLGTEAGLRFAALGHRVVGWRRSPAKLPAAIEGAAADLTAGNLPPVPKDATAVVIAVAADSPTEDAYRAAYVRGVENVLAALKRDAVSPERIIFVSSTAVYGDAGGGWVDESTPADPGGFSGRVLVEAEELLKARLEGTSTIGVSVRLGGIYGPGRTRLIDQVRSGSAVIPEDVRYTNRIHRDDAAAALVHLATMDAAPAPIYVGVDNEPADLGSVLRFLASELGLPARRVGDAGPARGGNKRCRNDLLRSTGFTLAFPTFREGYRDVIAGNGVRHP